MSYHKIDNIRVIVDVNRQQCDGAMSSVLDLGDLASRVASFGVTCRSVDGHDLGRYVQPLKAQSLASHSSSSPIPRLTKAWIS